MDFELTPDQAEWQASATRFARDRVGPLAAEIDESGEFPSALIADAASRDYLGLLVSREFGGKALDHVSYALAIEAVARASATVAVILAVHNSLVVRRHRKRWNGRHSRNSGSVASRPATCLAPLPSRRPMPAPTPPTSRRSATRIDGGYR